MQIKNFNLISKKEEGPIRVAVNLGPTPPPFFQGAETLGQIIIFWRSTPDQ